MFPIEITRIDRTMPLPSYKTEGAVAFDLYAREEVTIEPKSCGFVHHNIVVNTPKGYLFMISARSSTCNRKGLIMGNGVGIIDNDYNGPEDEIISCYFNLTDEPVVIEKGERISQGTFIKVERADIVDQEVNDNESRGGFGTTGTHE